MSPEAASLNIILSQGTYLLLPCHLLFKSVTFLFFSFIFPYPHYLSLSHSVRLPISFPSFLVPLFPLSVIDLRRYLSSCVCTLTLTHCGVFFEVLYMQTQWDCKWCKCMCRKLQLQCLWWCMCIVFWSKLVEFWRYIMHQRFWVFLSICSDISDQCLL